MQKAMDTKTPDAKTKNADSVLSSEIVVKILAIVHQQTGHDFSHYKKKTIHRRIQRRMQIHYISKFSDYLDYLEHTPDEAHILFKELLIGVTSFFRDEEVFTALKDTIIPTLLKNKPSGESLRIWIPGCSTGEEAYSIAILLYECLDQTKQRIKVQIFGTDIDTDAIDKARLGLYGEMNIAALTPERLEQFFTKENKFYRVKSKIREMLVFAPHNVIKDPPFTKLDMVCCRNLLIYLDNPLQKTLLPIFHYSLNEEGILLLGTSESIGNYLDIFTSIDKKCKIFKKRLSIASRQAILNFPVTSRQLHNVASMMDKQKDKTPSFQQLISKYLLFHYAPPSVLVNKQNEVIYIHGRTGKFLEPPPGPGQWKLPDMIRSELKATIMDLLSHTHANPHETCVKSTSFNEGTKQIKLNVIIKPIIENNIPDGLLLVMFEDHTDTVLQADPTSSSTTTHTTIPQSNTHLLELEKELKYTTENLQSSIEELEISNEELKSNNEELQSTNEELQSTNEEMETSKEELQSLNEELVTINTELQTRISQLSHSNDDMKNLLDSTEIATLFLDKKLCIKRFTPKATKIIHLIDSDIGRPLHHLVTNLEKVALEEQANMVARTLITLEREVRTFDSEWWYMRVTPYRTQTNTIEGVVITFDNITARKRTEKKLASLEQLWESIWTQLPDCIAELDLNGIIQQCNQPLNDHSINAILGHPYVNFLTSKERAPFKYAMAHVLDNGDSNTFTVPYDKEGQSCYFRMIPLYENQKIKSIIIIRTHWEEPNINSSKSTEDIYHESTDK